MTPSSSGDLDEREMTRQLAWEYVREIRNKVLRLEERVAHLERLERERHDGGKA